MQIFLIQTWLIGTHVIYFSIVSPRMTCAFIHGYHSLAWTDASFHISCSHYYNFETSSCSYFHNSVLSKFKFVFVLNFVRFHRHLQSIVWLRCLGSCSFRVFFLFLHSCPIVSCCCSGLFQVFQKLSVCELHFHKI